MIQNALLYNKIECYNTGVQRSPSLSQRLHSLLKAAYDPKYKLFGRAPKISAHYKDVQKLILSPWMTWTSREPSLTKSNGVSWGQMAAVSSDPT